MKIGQINGCSFYSLYLDGINSMRNLMMIPKYQQNTQHTTLYKHTIKLRLKLKV